MKNKVAIITGASSGIGKNIALELGRKNYILKKYLESGLKYERIKKNLEVDEIFLVARRKEKLLKLKAYIEKKYEIKCRVLAFDITKEENILKIKKILEEEQPYVKILVNSAGYGIFKKSYEISEESERGMIKLNVMALYNMTKICLKYLGKNPTVVNLSSAAAFIPESYFSVYAATKAFVSFYSMGLNREFKNVNFLTVYPGPVNTEFFDVNFKESKKEVFSKNTMASGKKVGKEIVRGIEKRKSYVIPSKFYKILYLLCGKNYEKYLSYVMSIVNRNLV